MNVSRLPCYMKPPWTIRYYSTALSFYQNRQLELYATREAKRLTLRQLVFFGRSMNEDRLLKSANYVRTELPVRIAHRIRDLQALPYVVVTQENVARVYELYWSAFEKLRQYPPVTSLKENQEFCSFLSGLLSEHATVIPSLSLGLSLCSPYLLPDMLDSFMRRMLVSRISRRVLAEHHISLSKSFNGEHPDQTDDTHVGIIFTALNVKKSIEKCAQLLEKRQGEFRDTGDGHSSPEVIIDGHVDTTFAYIREHLEYVIFEIMKNVGVYYGLPASLTAMSFLKAAHATLSKHGQFTELPPIRATIAAGNDSVSIRISDQGGGLPNPTNQIKSPSDLFSFSHLRNSARLEVERLSALRSASTRRSGMQATVGEQLERWKQSAGAAPDPEQEAGVGHHGRLGIGLPMSNIFATYFKGSLELVSLNGWGTDVYLSLPRLGTNLEGIEL